MKIGDPIREINEPQEDDPLSLPEPVPADVPAPSDPDPIPVPS